MLLVGTLIVAAILAVGAVWTGNDAGKDTEEAVHSVSLLYLDELAGRREQVVEHNLKDNIRVINLAIDLMSPDDLSDMEHLQAYQARMKQLFQLEKFAFVDANGLIYTSLGTQNDIDLYSFDPAQISEPEVSIKNKKSEDKKVVIAVPVADIPFNGQILKCCFMEIDMNVMLEGLALQKQQSDATFCNIYASDGTPLSNVVLGGLAVETNLLEAFQNAEFNAPYSLSGVVNDFAKGQRGVVTFTYHDINETLSYIPIDGTDWMLTYLIRESLISEQIAPVTNNIVRRGLLQSVLAIAILLGLFAVIIIQTRRSARFALEREKAETEAKIKQEELEERLKLQEKLQEQSEILAAALTAAEEANKAKTTFLSNMSHEIRTPMNAIIGLDSIALEDPALPESTREYLEKIGESADHLLQLINDILDMSRIESGRMTLHNKEFSFRKLMDAIDAIFSVQCAEKGLEYSCRINGPIDEYYIGDDIRLRQILINILGNAVKFTPEGGRVDVTVERTAQYDGNSTLQFQIRDTGIGISEEYLPHIFDTFSQENASEATKYGSSGLGLAITKNIVEMMNGNIYAESVKGEGTTFTVILTLTDSDRGPESVSGSETSGAGQRKTGPEEKAELAGRRILLAEDVRVNAEIICMLLKTREVETELAENGRMAVDLFASHPEGYYDAILMDMRMPEMDGLEATRLIRGMDRPDAKKIPIIALTANAFEEDVQRSLQAGLDAHLSKPVPAPLLFATLESLLR